MNTTTIQQAVNTNDALELLKHLKNNLSDMSNIDKLNFTGSKKNIDIRNPEQKLLKISEQIQLQYKDLLFNTKSFLIDGITGLIATLENEMANIDTFKKYNVEYDTEKNLIKYESEWVTNELDQNKKPINGVVAVSFSSQELRVYTFNRVISIEVLLATNKAIYNDYKATFGTNIDVKASPILECKVTVKTS